MEEINISMETETEIYFYGTKDRFDYMSNFYRTSFVENGIPFNCSEQYFMYHKCLLFDPKNKRLQYTILRESCPSKVRQFGRQVANYNEEIWEKERYNIMLNALKLKFGQNYAIKEKLLSTGNKNLYEASKHDRIWGIGYRDMDALYKPRHKFGQNLLGKVLMEIRNELRQ